MEITDAAVRVDPHGEAAAADTTVIATENQLSIAGSLSTWVGKGTAVDRTRWASLMRGALLDAPPTLIRIGYSPLGRFGTTTFACAKLIDPGVRPANCTSANCPPTVTVTSSVALQSVPSKGAGAPVATR